MKDSTFSQEFELEVLHCLVGDAKFLKESFSVVRPNCFINTTYALAFNVIAQSYIQTKSAPSRIGFLSSLVEACRREYSAKKSEEEVIVIGPCKQITDYIYSPVSNANDVKTMWLLFCKERECSAALLENLKLMEEGKQDFSTTFEKIRQVERRINATSQGGLSLFDRLDKLEDKYASQNIKKYTTGYPTMDKWMNGGMSAGTLSTIIAAPKGGKSMSLANIAYHNLKRGHNVVFFTCEISQDKTEDRLISRISGISLDDLPKMPKTAAEKCAQFYLDHNCNLYIKEYAPGTASVNDFRSYLYWLEGETGIKPHVMLMDYGDLIRPIDKHNELRHGLNAVWTEMRGLQSEFNTAGATASQCNREAIDKPVIRMKDVAEALGKVAVSDHIWTNCRTDEEEKQSKGRIFFAGSREAQSGGIFPIGYDWKHCIIRETNDKIKQTEAFE